MPRFPIKGLEKSSIDRINKELLQKRNLIEPRYIPVVERVTYQGKEIIVLWVPDGADRPCKCPVQPFDGRANLTARMEDMKSSLGSVSKFLEMRFRRLFRHVFASNP